MPKYNFKKYKTVSYKEFLRYFPSIKCNTCGKESLLVEKKERKMKNKRRKSATVHLD